MKTYHLTLLEIWCMRNLLLIIIVIIIGFLVWKFAFNKKAEAEPARQEALAVSKHSKEFNESVRSSLTSYFTLTDDFMNWDSVKANNDAKSLQQSLSNLKLEDLKKDSAAIQATAQSFIDNAKGNTEDIIQGKTIEEKRRGFQNLTDNLYNFLRTVRYDESKLYLQECPMAFNDSEAAQWLSKTEEIKNPYLGIHHPRYGKSMVSCGETKDTLNFTGW